MTTPLVQSCPTCGRDHGNLHCDAPISDRPDHLARMNGDDDWIDEIEAELSRTGALAIHRFVGFVLITLITLITLIAAGVALLILTALLT